MSMTKHGLASSIAQAILIQKIYIPSQGSLDERIFSLRRDVTEGSKISINEIEKTPTTRDGNPSRVAILRDKEKDHSDPDYDCSYERYVKGLLPNQSFSLGPYSTQSFQPPFVQYEVGFSQHGMLSKSQASLSYRSSTPNMSLHMSN
ncbi:hypothetical protein IFM89_008958 [Coptis chinensis]|uniref:Uncharacterized protein n=1 Tax=Coptis chinensis TaxID=261450 RepID=A0A835M236_9MAGN|nr:hypothetical protein IFM89_008958 [Coptis chinensis]